jgi:hypothetical protein
MAAARQGFHDARAIGRMAAAFGHALAIEAIGGCQRSIRCRGELRRR